MTRTLGDHDCGCEWGSIPPNAACPIHRRPAPVPSVPVSDDEQACEHFGGRWPCRCPDGVSCNNPTPASESRADDEGEAAITLTLGQREVLLSAAGAALRVRSHVLLLASHATGHLPDPKGGDWCRECKTEWPCAEVARTAAPALEAVADLPSQRPAAPVQGDGRDEGLREDPWIFGDQSAALYIARAANPWERDENRQEWAPKMLTNRVMFEDEATKAEHRLGQAIDHVRSLLDGETQG